MTKREFIAECYPDAVFLEEKKYDAAITGVANTGQVIYSYDGLVEVLMVEDEMTFEQAVDWADSNIERSLPYQCEHTPILDYGLPEDVE